jgi:hypothetical protein
MRSLPAFVLGQRATFIVPSPVFAAGDAGSTMAIASERILAPDTSSRIATGALRGGGTGAAGGPNRLQGMDHGPVLSDAISAAIPPGNLAIKGHAVRLINTPSA